MAQVIAFEQAIASRFRDKGGNLRTPFLNSSADTPEKPLAFLMEYEPSYVTLPHFHLVDQWQVIVGGEGKLGRHNAAPYSVHYTRACTPYGPVVGGDRAGISFFVLFACFQPGAQFLPAARPALDAVPNRRPWQITREVAFPALDANGNGVATAAVPDVEDGNGLFAQSLAMSPSSRAVTSGAAAGSGQYQVVVKGSMWHENREHKAPALIYLSPDEEAFELHAGPKGLEAIILNFPRSPAAGAVATSAS